MARTALTVKATLIRAAFAGRHEDRKHISISGIEVDDALTIAEQFDV
jgi:hypothetical protein